MNTSFNIHGESIVGTPEDAIDTFLRCGLHHLLIGGWLVSKSDFTMKKYIYFVTNQNHWFNVSKNFMKWVLQNLFCGWEYSMIAKAIFEDNVVLDLIHRHRNYELVDIEYNGEYEEFFSENYLRAKDRCIKMMDRLDLYGTFGRLDRETTFITLLYRS